MLNDFKELLAHLLGYLFNSITTLGLIPTQWCMAEIILHKQGDRTEINNYRLISLSSDVGKVYVKIIENRIYNNLDAQQPAE